MRVARQIGATGLSHGCTGKGNDQVRFELGAYALNPDIRIIAPWREWDLNSRESLLAYAETHGIAIEQKKGGGSPYSMDANLLHTSYEGGELEDPWYEARDEMWLRSVSPENAPWIAGRQPYGRISIANSDAAANAMTEGAIGEAYRAVTDLVSA